MKIADLNRSYNFFFMWIVLIIFY